MIFIYSNYNFQKVSAQESQNEIEKALFTLQEFFGSQAIVPFPTAQARENLDKLNKRLPKTPEIILKLAELDEKLGKFDLAEKELLELAEIDSKYLENLAIFYNRRAWFEKEASILHKIFVQSPNNQKPQIFERLIECARIYDLQNYLQPEFFQQIAQDNQNLYSVFKTLIDKLIEQQNFVEALKFIRQAKINFPNQKNVLLKKEVAILIQTNQIKEAEKVYKESFDLFWSSRESEDFYRFLSNYEKLRIYSSELRKNFKQNPNDFETAMRLAHFRKYNYESITPIIQQLEKAKKDWTTEELITVTRLLLQENNGELASKFLYTLHVRNELKPNSELRAKILYQLFKIFCEADQQRLSMTRGDLHFYEDVAKSDTNPGITTGILSIVFSNSKPRQQFENAENTATKFFNRAAAYRVFSAYKQEYPTSPELAQMYLDIVTIYTATKETDIAQKTLTEFEQRYANSTNYVQVALKLADAYLATEQPEKEREIYQKILDYLGKDKIPSVSKIELDDIQEDDSNKDAYQEKTSTNYEVSLVNKTKNITYGEVLERLINSLAKDKRTDKILEVYSNEIGKYPMAEWLYEQRLNWLEQTNLTEEQLKVYKTANDKFQTRSWQDKLARWFIKQNRNDEFNSYSTELVGKLNDSETADYLAQFIDSKVGSIDFDEQLYFKLYETAHQRFPHNIYFVKGLLRFYELRKQTDNWRKLSAEYYFESKEVRENFLDNLAKTAEIRNYLSQANEKRNSGSTIYEIFRADASVRLSNYEEAVDAYRKLNQIYPNSPEISERLVAFTRSFGQKDRENLIESATLANSNADFLPSSAYYRTESGEIFAELGNYTKSREEWEKLIPIASGISETYLDTATVYWDYYQYDDALRTIRNLREKVKNQSLYAFEMGAILDAQHKQNEAINEYVKALGKDEAQSHNAKKRLKTLAKNSEFFKQINQTVVTQIKQRKDADWLALAYADFGENLQNSALDIPVNQKESIRSITANILKQEISFSKDEELLAAAKDFYSYTKNKKGKQDVLKRLGEISESPRQIISYQLRLADSFSESGEKNQASMILANLVQKYPTNYGVLTESSDFYWRLGESEKSIDVLQKGFSIAKGEYKNNIAFRLSKRFISLNRLDSAEKLLTDLHAENPINTEVFEELTNVLVQENKLDQLRNYFRETVSALKKTNTDPKEIEWKIADLRKEMIEAFTKLKDYSSAVEQHIEIINREPDEEENVENAIKYVKRYGGAETLLEYYQKTAAEAFKNYRWNVVLARIYEANKDWENAIKNYKTALINQPEMAEFYVSIADIETERKNYDEAIKNINKALELRNNERQLIKHKIEILKKAGRIAEIEIEKAKLPIEEKTKGIDQFAEARKLQASEKEKFIELYHQAFTALMQNPLTQDFKSSDITGYVQTMRGVETLDQINEKFWQLRDKLSIEIEKTNSKDAGEARNRLNILDSAITNAIGDTARNFGTEIELANLNEFYDKKINDYSKRVSSINNFTVLQNVSHNLGFGNLEEKILKIKLEKAVGEDIKICLQNLLDFYKERGAYQKVLEVLEQKDFSNYGQIAETAKLIGNYEKETEALRKIYEMPKDKLEETPNPLVARYLEILYANNRTELNALTEKNSAYQLQLINFLIGKGEKELSHKAIEHISLSTSWKVARNAETSLALKEFDENSECYFCNALQISSIGEFINQKPDKARFLVGNDWFRLSKSYGEWLYENPHKTEKPSNYLTAMIENLPKNAAEQFNLGQFYLEKKDAKNAIEHFHLALELNKNDKNSLINLGAAYFLLGQKQKAEEIWSQVIENEDIDNCQIYLETLQKYGLASNAQYSLLPIIVKHLNDENTEENFKQLLRNVAESFTTETAKTIYFQKILNEAKDNVLLPEILIKESLVAENSKCIFYEMLIDRSRKSDDSDYEFVAVLQRISNPEDAEEVYTQENNYEISEPENERINWQKEYLEYLLTQRQFVKAQQLIENIKNELKGFYARPTWLILAEMKLQIAENKFSISDAKRFIGTEITSEIAEIKPPDIGRFNSLLQILKDEKRDSEANQLFESFFARMLAFEQYETTNFVGLSRLYFQAGDKEKAVKLLQMMIDIADTDKRETTLAEIDEMEIVKNNAVDKTKSTQNKETNDIGSINERLNIAAEISLEYGQLETAINFRQKLLEIAPEDSANKYELAQIFVKNNNKSAATGLLLEISKDQNSTRNHRWQSIWLLREMAENVEIKDLIFDSYSQFYNGLLAEKSNQYDLATSFFINSLIADKDRQSQSMQYLAKMYAQTDKPFAALKIAELDKISKSNELLDLLSQTAERVGDFNKAIEFEKAKTADVNQERIKNLQELAITKNKRMTDFTVDLQNVRK